MKINKVIALIPARSGSIRIKNKNIKKINGHPLIAYAINSAINSKIFDEVLCLTDSKKYKRVAEYYGAKVPFLRSKKSSSSTSPDIQWVNATFNKIKNIYTHFFILRPTNPLRNSKLIRKAWKKFNSNKTSDTLRTVKQSSEHPLKMWRKDKNFIRPLYKVKINKQPSYNCQSKVFEKIFVQNGFLEIAKVSVLNKFKTITGNKIIPFFIDKKYDLDINTKDDLEYLDFLLKRKKVKLEKILKKPFRK
jgi:CMP-N,N'-diacetyllegionaminic acid synthase